MSGISGSGRHVASHAKPGAIDNAKGKVKTAAAVTSVLAVSGGVATAFHLHQDGLRNSAEAASQDSNTAAAAAAANALAVRANTAANRDLARPTLGQSSTSAPGAPTSPVPSSDSSSSAAPAPAPKPTSTSTSTTQTPLPTQTSTSTPTKTATPLPTKTPTSTSTSSGSSTNLGIGDTPTEAKALAETIVPSGQFACFANIISRESSWNIYATNPSSGAYGLGQALPGYKMASMGSEWRNSALIQIKWALSYMTGRYGSPCAAWTFWQAHDWY